MRGEIIAVWKETWREIWTKLAKHREFGDDLFRDFYRELVPRPGGNTPESQLPEQQVRERIKYDTIVSSAGIARKAFRELLTTAVATEIDCVRVLETLFNVIEGYGDENFKNRYFVLIQNFIEKFSLRYELRRPFILIPSLAGIFTKLDREVQSLSLRDEALSRLTRDYKEALQDLKQDQTSGRIKTCIQKQVNLLEGLGTFDGNLTGNTLSELCDAIQQWPHPAIPQAIKKLYGFTSDAQGIRHGTRDRAPRRDIDLRDLIALSVIFAGISPYLTEQINAELVYGGGSNQYVTV